MKTPWFKKTGWIYTPTTWQGIFVTTALLIFCVHIFLFVDGNSYSTSDTLYGVFPFIVPTFLLYLWIGSEKSS